MSEGIQAPELLERAVAAMKERAAERDCEAERSMAGCVGAFNALFEKELSVEEGWFFMALLKMSRASSGALQLDDHVDGAAYFALAGEAAGEAALGRENSEGEDCSRCGCEQAVVATTSAGYRQCRQCGWFFSGPGNSEVEDCSNCGCEKTVVMNPQAGFKHCKRCGMY
jgi:hypothetical protein